MFTLLAGRADAADRMLRTALIAASVLIAAALIAPAANGGEEACRHSSYSLLAKANGPGEILAAWEEACEQESVGKGTRSQRRQRPWTFSPNTV
jgi:hypothetical protein